MLRCVPERLCKRERQGYKFACVLKPGIGRWIGMTNAVGKNTAALAAALLRQAHCTEPDAGPFCIASPIGLGAAAEALGHFLTLGYGSLATVRAIETPGGDDDRQWLTFWLVYSLVTMAKAVLDYVSILVPFYHEIWLGLMLWLGLLHGADWVYKNILRPVAKQHEDKIDYVLARGKSVEALIKSAEKKA